MAGNHHVPHTAEAKLKMSLARKGKPLIKMRRPMLVVDGVELYRCSTCRDFFPRGSFYSTKRTVLGIKNQCKKCHCAMSIATRTPSLHRAARRLDECNRRARIAGVDGVISRDDLDRLVEILGSCCLACGSVAPFTIDHVVPLSKGGANRPENLQLLCRPCNERKYTRTVDYRTEAQREAVNAVWAISFRRLPGQEATS